MGNTNNFHGTINEMKDEPSHSLYLRSLQRWKEQFVEAFQKADHKKLVECIIKFIEYVINYTSGMSCRSQILICRNSFALFQELVDSGFANTIVKHVTQRIFEIIIEEGKNTWCIKREILKTFNHCIGESSKAVRYKTVSDLSDIYLFKIMDSISSYGDYDLQVMVIETIFRMYGRATINAKLKDLIPESQELSQSFEEISPERFDVDVRFFLNQLNKISGKIFSIVCDEVAVGDILCIPPTDSVGGIWVDFNTWDSAITWYCSKSSFNRSHSDSESNDIWNLISLFISDVETVSIHRAADKSSSIIHCDLKSSCLSSFEDNQSILDRAKNVSFLLSGSAETDKLINEVLPVLFGKKLQRPSQPSESRINGTNKVSTSAKLEYRPLDITVKRKSRSVVSGCKSNVSGLTSCWDPLKSSTTKSDETAQRLSMSSYSSRAITIDSSNSSGSLSDNEDFKTTPQIQILSGRCTKYSQFHEDKNVVTPKKRNISTHISTFRQDREEKREVHAEARHKVSKLEDATPSPEIYESAQDLPSSSLENYQTAIFESQETYILGTTRNEQNASRNRGEILDKPEVTEDFTSLEVNISKNDHSNTNKVSSFLDSRDNTELARKETSQMSTGKGSPLIGTTCEIIESPGFEEEIILTGEILSDQFTEKARKKSQFRKGKERSYLNSNECDSIKVSIFKSMNNKDNSEENILQIRRELAPIEQVDKDSLPGKKTLEKGIRQHTISGKENILKGIEKKEKNITKIVPADSTNDRKRRGVQKKIISKKKEANKNYIKHVSKEILESIPDELIKLAPEVNTNNRKPRGRPKQKNSKSSGAIYRESSPNGLVTKVVPDDKNKNQKRKMRPQEIKLNEKQKKAVKRTEEIIEEDNSRKGKSRDEPKETSSKENAEIINDEEISKDIMSFTANHGDSNKDTDNFAVEEKHTFTKTISTNDSNPLLHNDVYSKDSEFVQSNNEGEIEKRLTTRSALMEDKINNSSTDVEQTVKFSDPTSISENGKNANESIENREETGNRDPSIIGRGRDPMPTSDNDENECDFEIVDQIIASSSTSDLTKEVECSSRIIMETSSSATGEGKLKKFIDTNIENSVNVENIVVDNFNLNENSKSDTGNDSRHVEQRLEQKNTPKKLCQKPEINHSNSTADEENKDHDSAVEESALMSFQKKTPSSDGISHVRAEFRKIIEPENRILKIEIEKINLTSKTHRSDEHIEIVREIAVDPKNAINVEKTEYAMENEISNQSKVNVENNDAEQVEKIQSSTQDVNIDNDNEGDYSGKIHTEADPQQPTTIIDPELAFDSIFGRNENRTTNDNTSSNLVQCKDSASLFDKNNAEIDNNRMIQGPVVTSYNLIGSAGEVTENLIPTEDHVGSPHANDSAIKQHTVSEKPSNTLFSEKLEDDEVRIDRHNDLTRNISSSHDVVELIDGKIKNSRIERTNRVTFESTVQDDDNVKKSVEKLAEKPNFSDSIDTNRTISTTPSVRRKRKLYNPDDISHLENMSPIQNNSLQSKRKKDAISFIDNERPEKELLRKPLETLICNQPFDQSIISERNMKETSTSKNEKKAKKKLSKGEISYKEFKSGIQQQEVNRIRSSSNSNLHTRQPRSSHLHSFFLEMVEDFREELGEESLIMKLKRNCHARSSTRKKDSTGKKDKIVVNKRVDKTVKSRRSERLNRPKKIEHTRTYKTFPLPDSFSSSSSPGKETKFPEAPYVEKTNDIIPPEIECSNQKLTLEIQEKNKVVDKRRKKINVLSNMRMIPKMKDHRVQPPEMTQSHIPDVVDNKGRTNDMLISQTIVQTSYLGPKVSKPAPYWEATAVLDGEFIQLNSSYYLGKYLILFFYPLDFSFVRPEDILSFSKRIDEFKKVNTEVLACSVDSHYAHLAWMDTLKEERGVDKLNFPLLSDLKHNISKAYGVFLEDRGHTIRGIFIIDPKGIIRQITMNDISVFNSVDETLRLVKAFHYADERVETY